VEKNTYKHNILLTLLNKSRLFTDNKKNDAKNLATCRIEPGSSEFQSNAIPLFQSGLRYIYVLQPYISEVNSYSCRSDSTSPSRPAVGQLATSFFVCACVYWFDVFCIVCFFLVFTFVAFFLHEVHVRQTKKKQKMQNSPLAPVSDV